MIQSQEQKKQSVSSARRGTRSKSIWVTDPGLIIVKTKLSKAQQMDHDCAVLQLANAVHLRISSIVNYDHVKTTVPKSDIPLSDEKQKFDLSWETPTHNIILVEVKVLKKWKKNTS